MATIIIAGGPSSRMGQDKASLPIGNSTLLHCLTSKFNGEFGLVIVVARPEQYLTLEGVLTVSDKFPGKGPLGGLHAGLLASPDEYNFVLACDMPFADPNVARYLVARSDGHDAVVPVLTHGYEPLHAVYRKTCLPKIEANLAAGTLRLKDMLYQVDTVYIKEDELRDIDPCLSSFTNINTPEEYARLSVLYPAYGR